MLRDKAHPDNDEFEVQCFHCKGRKGRTTKQKGRMFAYCPNCGCALDIINITPVALQKRIEKYRR